jgi:predicted DNA-binding transcriptional regulator YafY
MAVNPELHQLLYGAIQNKRLIRFRYKDKERIVEPHDYGILKEITRLLSWQVGGQSGSRLPGWRWFDVTDIRDVEVLERSFPGNREVSGKHHQWDQIFIRVASPKNSRQAG